MSNSRDEDFATAEWVMERAQRVAEAALQAIQAAAIVNNLELSPDVLETMLEGICEGMYDAKEVKPAHKTLKAMGENLDVTTYPADHKNLCKRVSFVISDAIRVKHPTVSDVLLSAFKPRTA